MNTRYIAGQLNGEDTLVLLRGDYQGMIQQRNKPVITFTHPFSWADVETLDFAAGNDKIIFAHPNYAPHILSLKGTQPSCEPMKFDGPTGA